MDENLIKPISPSPAGVKQPSKKQHANKRQRKKKEKGKGKRTSSSSTQGKVIDDYA